MTLNCAHSSSDIFDEWNRRSTCSREKIYDSNTYTYLDKIIYFFLGSKPLFFNEIFDTGGKVEKAQGGIFDQTSFRMLPDRPDTGDEQVNGGMGRGQKGGVIVHLSGRIHDILLKIFNTVAVLLNIV